MKKKFYLVGVYKDHHWVADLKFKRKWVALLAHNLIMKNNQNSDVLATFVEWSDD